MSAPSSGTNCHTALRIVPQKCLLVGADVGSHPKVFGDWKAMLGRIPTATSEIIVRADEAHVTGPDMSGDPGIRSARSGSTHSHLTVGTIALALCPLLK
jgi:hypothetical protein